MEDNRMPDLFRLIEIKVESDLQFGQWVRRIFSSMFNNRLISFFILLQLVLVLLSIPAYYEVRIKTANMKCDDNCRKDVKENIKYGEMISLAYDMLQDNVKSINYQENILGCDDFSEQLIECLYPDYEYEDDLIAFPNSAVSSEKIHEDGSFFGFVAANKKKRDIAIVIRGSFTKDDWGANSRFYGSIWDYNYNETVTEIVSWCDLKDWYASFKGWWLISCFYSAFNFEDVVLSAGFYDLYRTNTAVSNRSLKKQIEEHVNHLTASGEFKTITVTGHSLGGAIATIAALEIAMQLRCIDVISKPQIRLVTYSSPVVGNGILWKKLKQLGVSDRHYFITGDSVPYMFMQYNWLTSYTHGRDTRRLRLAPANEVLKPEWKTARQVVYTAYCKTIICGFLFIPAPCCYHIVV